MGAKHSKKEEGEQSEHERLGAIKMEMREPIPGQG